MRGCSIFHFGGNGSGESSISISLLKKDVKAMHASKYTDLSNTSDKNVSADDNVLSFKYQGDPDVLLTNE